MSVINKMLKDLDERAPETDMGNPQTASSLYVEQPSKSVNKILLLLLSIIAVALIFIAGKMYFSSTEPSVPELTKQGSSKSISEEAKPTLKNSTDEVQKASVEVLKDEKVDTVDESSNFNAEVKQTVTAQRKPDSEVVSQNNSTAVASKNDAERRVTESNQAEPNQTEPVNKNDEVVVSVQPEQVAEVTASEPLNRELQVAVSQPQVEQTAQPKFIIEKSTSRLTPEQRIEKLVAEAQTAFDKGYITEGVDKLNQVLSIADGHVEARNMLAAAWYGRGELNKAVGILNDGLQRYPQIEQWRLTAAKIFFKENNPVGAFSYLEAELTNGSREFYSMKGSLASQLKRHDKAESAYTQLTQIEPNAGNWWLGLAVAQDSQGKQADAKNSYQNVLSRGGVSQSSLNFVRQRLTELEG